MHYSTDRILVTHAGSLPRPPDLRAMVVAKSAGEPYDAAALDRRLTEAVAETVRRQRECGIDIVDAAATASPAAKACAASVGRRAGLMKVVFLGRFATGHAPRIVARLTTTPDTEIIADDTDAARLAPALAEADIVVGLSWRAGFPPAPRLKLLQCFATGIDQMDLAAVPRGVAVCNTVGHEPPIAEYVIMTMLTLLHQLFHSVASFRAGSWEASLQGGGTRHGELLGKTVGIIGYGRIGREVARRAAPFGVRLLAANRSPVGDAAPVERVYPLADLDRMLPECDIVVIAAALAPETKGLIDARRLAMMKPAALLINIGRGLIVDEAALYTALHDGRLGGAAIDVWWRYPTAAEPHPRPSRFSFHDLPNVLMTPHSSSYTEGTAERRYSGIVTNIDRLSRGEPPINVVTVT